MRTEAFGASGIDVPVIGQGTWDFPETGGRLDEAIRALRLGVELGATHIDTAEMYGAGRVEELVGEAVAPLPREQLFLTGKVLPSNATFEGTITACERSLRRMRTEYLDLYLLHWPSEHPFEETARAFERLVRDGKVRHVGVSNFDVEALREACAMMARVPIVCNQVLYHLRERGIEHSLLSVCRELGVAIVAYTPFGRARFPSPKSVGGSTLARIAAQHGVHPRQVVLAFLTREPSLFTIPKAARCEHVRQNVAAAALQLDDADFAALDVAFPIGDERALATL